MKKCIGAILILSLVGCSTCKSSDTPDVCRTKERNHSQPRVDISDVSFIKIFFAAFSL